MSDFEESESELPEADSVELNKIGMQGFGYKLVDLAREYGDEGSDSKGLFDLEVY